MKYSEVCNFADDTYLLNCNSYLKYIDKQVDSEVKDLSNQLKANQIFLNVGKTKLVSFTLPKKQLKIDLRTKLNGRCYKTDSIKCLRIPIDKSVAWKQEINHVAINLNKTTSMLSKSREVLDRNTLRLVY